MRCVSGSVVAGMGAARACECAQRVRPAVRSNGTYSYHGRRRQRSFTRRSCARICIPQKALWLLPESCYVTEAGRHSAGCAAGVRQLRGIGVWSAGRAVVTAPCSRRRVAGDRRAYSSVVTQRRSPHVGLLLCRRRWHTDTRLRSPNQHGVRVHQTFVCMGEQARDIRLLPYAR